MTLAPSAHRFCVAVLMDPAFTPDLMDAAQWDHLEEVAEILNRLPIKDPSESHAAQPLADAEVVLSGWGCPPFDDGLLARMPRLRFVAHTGSSVRHLVSDLFWERRIKISSAAAANAQPVAEFALAAILLANKEALSARESYREIGKPLRLPWTAPDRPGNFGAVVGIVGASRTGRRLLDLLRPFDLQVLVHDPYADPDDIRMLGAELVLLADIAARSDVVSLHAPLTAETLHMIDSGFLASLHDGATVINTARGGIMDHNALERELRSGRLSAILDVTDPEPLPPDSLLLKLPNVFVTPHLAGAAGRETTRLANLAIDEIALFSAGHRLMHEVTRDLLVRIG